MSFEYKKSLGQNFLKDNNIIDKISNSINPSEKDLIIEIGPGDGALTKKLINKKCDIICFEIDKRLEEKLNAIKSDKLKLYFEDFLKVDLNKYISSKYEKIYFIGNLPYYITTAIINKITSEAKPTEIVIMIQKEVGQRFMANTKTKQYNSLSVFLQYNYDIKKICDVSRNCFEPKPKVDSIVLSLKKHNKYSELVKDEKVFYKLIKDSFKQKRKTLKNNLNNYDLDKVNKALNIYGKSINNRAEEIGVEEFIEISNKLIS